MSCAGESVRKRTEVSANLFGLATPEEGSSAEEQETEAKTSNANGLLGRDDENDFTAALHAAHRERPKVWPYG